MASNFGANKRGRRQRSMADAKNGNDKKRGKGGRLSPAKDKLTVPLFLQKTYEMINTCDPEIATWTEDGEMFVVKNISVFEKTVIPQYFDHNKFSSFARQLNFYGFRKMQIRPIRNDEYDQETSKHITFVNEDFKRGREDLLPRIQRSTKGNASAANQEQQQDIKTLKEKVEVLESHIYGLHSKMAEMEENHQHQWEAFIHQFQRPYEQMNHPSQSQGGGNDVMNAKMNVERNSGYTPDVHTERKPDYLNNSNLPYTNSGNAQSHAHTERKSGYSNDPNTPYSSAQEPPRRQKSKVTISEEVEELKPRQPTLKPHPNSKTLPDNVLLPPPPGTSEPAFRGPSRGISFLRGFSRDFTDIGLFDSERPDEQVSIPPPSNSEINEMQQPDLSSFQQRYFKSMMSETDIMASSKSSNSNTVGTDMSSSQRESPNRSDEIVNIPPPTNGPMSEMQKNDLSSFHHRYFQSVTREDAAPSSIPSNAPSNTVGIDMPPPEPTNRYGAAIAKHAAKNMETLQNLNLNCNGMEKPEMNRVPTVIDALPPM